MRRYASFFQSSDRERAELGVVEELVHELERRGRRTLRDPSSYKPDPTDCICTNEQGGLVAVEVTEVVCQEAARLNEQGEQVYRNWRAGELRGQIARQLKDKDAKTFHGGPYQEILVCLFTDEPVLSHAHIQQELDGVDFGPFKQLTGAYLVVSYDPGTKGYPVHELRLQNAA
jgi:hypothetical protein